MDKTKKDLKKLSNKAFSAGKTLLYYGYIPLICILGAKTINWDAIMNSNPPM